MKSSSSFILLMLLILFVASNCSDYEVFEPEPSTTEDQWTTINESLKLPRSPESYRTFNSGVSDFNNNMIATIGRVLFYDKDLSADGTISCASCHHQELAFADNVSFSKGVHENLTTRNSIAFASIASFNDEYGGTTGGGEQTETTAGLFWDERAPTVKAQMEQTFVNPDEMGMDITELESIVKSKPYYQALFDLTQFQFVGNEDKGITTNNILLALETFVRSIRSDQSKFDFVARNNDVLLIEDFKNDWEGFTPSENHGKTIFAEHCGNCHGKSVIGQNFIITNHSPAPTTANNGLNKIYKDKGVGAITQLQHDMGKFKIAGLRNISLTAPYMHDGRFATLEEVIDFYDDGIQNHENLDPNLKDSSGKPINLNLTQEDKQDLIAFLHTLTDEEMLKASKWSDPFKR